MSLPAKSSKREKVREKFKYATTGIIGAPKLLHDTCGGGEIIPRRRQVNGSGKRSTRWFCTECRRFLVGSTKPLVFFRIVRRRKKKSK